MDDQTLKDLQDLAEGEAAAWLAEFKNQDLPRAKQAVRNLTRLSAEMLVGTDPVKLKAAVDVELSKLASLSSLQISQVRIRSKALTAKALGLLLDKLLG